MQQNPFADLIPGQRASPQPQGAIQPVIPRPAPQPTPETPEQIRSRELQDRLRTLEIGAQEREAAQSQEEQARRAATAQTIEETRAEIANVIEAARRAQQRSREGWFMTGIGSEWIGGNTPQGASLRGDLDVIGSNTAFSRLQAMRADPANRTGGALGAISERELQLLQNSTASLDPSQSDADFQRNMQAIIDRYQRIYDRLGGSQDPLEGVGGRRVNIGRIIEEETTPPRPEGQVLFDDEARPPPNPAAPIAEAMQAAYDRGATREELLEIARRAGVQPDVAEIDAALADPRRRGRFVPEAMQPDISDARGGEGGVNPLGMTGALGIGGEQIDAGIRGAADVLSLGMSDEIAAAGDTIFGRGGTYAENLYRQRGIDEYDTQNNFGSRLTGQLAGGALLPTGVGRATFGGARNALATGASREMARSAARRAGARRLGTEGAAFGGLYGFGSSEGSFTDRLTSGGISALVGGGAGYGLGRGVGALVSRYGRGGQGSRYADRVEASDAMGAANELGIDMLPADVGGPFTRRMTGGAAQLPFAAGPIMRRAENTVSQARSARDDIAQATGNVLDPEAAGETARRGAMTYRTESRDQVGRAYDRAAELASNAEIRPSSAIGVLDRNIEELSQVPGGAAGLERLQRLRDELVGESRDVLDAVQSIIGRRLSPSEMRLVEGVSPPPTFSIQGLRGMRTALRDEFLQQGLRGSDLERRVNQVVDAVSDDIATGLTRQGRGEAAQAYRAADQLHRERVRMIDDVLGPIIGQRGEKSGEQVVGALQRAMKGDSRRAREFMGALPRAEQDDVRATLISQLGRATPGQQNAEGTAFSLSTFLSNWSALQPSAREAVFGRAANRALGELAKVANRSRQAQRFANTSNTGGASNVSELTRGLSYLSGYGTLGATAIIENVTGRMLSNPVFARWLARAPETPAQAQSNIAMLGKIARTQPAISAEVLGLQRMLMPQAGRAAASPDEGPYQQQ